MTVISANAEIAEKFSLTDTDVPDLTNAARTADALGPKYPLKFHFRLERMLFEVLIEQQDDGVNLMSLRAIVNKLPFTAENPDKRRTLKNLVKQADPTMPGRVFLDRNQRILFEMKTRLDSHQPHRAPELAASGYMTAIVICLLQAKPYLSSFTL